MKNNELRSRDAFLKVLSRTVSPNVGMTRAKCLISAQVPARFRFPPITAAMWTALAIWFAGALALGAAPATESAWGEAVEGVQVRLRAKQTNWKVSTIPRLFVDVRNHGTRRLLVQKQMHGCEVEVDGQRFLRQPDTHEVRARPSPFPPGREYDGILINLDDYWILPRKSRDPASLDRMVRLKDVLLPGQHTVRVVVSAMADKIEPGKPVRAVSNPVALEILPK